MAEGRIIAVYEAVGRGKELVSQFRDAFPDEDIRFFVSGPDVPGGAEQIPEDVKGEASKRNWIN